MNGENKSLAEANLISNQSNKQEESHIIQTPIQTTIRQFPLVRTNKKSICLHKTIPILFKGPTSSGKSSFLSFLLNSFSHEFDVKDPARFSPFSQISTFENIADNYKYEKHRKLTILPKTFLLNLSIENENCNILLIDTPGRSSVNPELLSDAIPKIKFATFDFSVLELIVTKLYIQENIENDMKNEDTTFIIITKIDLAFINLQMSPEEIEQKISKFKFYFNPNVNIYVSSALTGVLFKVQNSLLSKLKELLSLYKIIFNSNDDSELQSSLNKDFNFEIKIDGSFKRKYYNGLNTMKDRLHKIPFYKYIKIDLEHKKLLKEINNTFFKRIQNDNKNKEKKEKENVNLLNIELDNIWTNFNEKEQNSYIINFSFNTITPYLQALLSSHNVVFNKDNTLKIVSLKLKEEPLFNFVNEYKILNNKEAFTIYNLEIESMLLNEQLTNSLKILSLLFYSFNYKFTESKTIKLYFNSEIEIDYIMKLIRLFNPENEFLLSVPSANLLESVTGNNKDVCIENDCLTFQGCFISNALNDLKVINDNINNNITNDKNREILKFCDNERRTENYIVFNKDIKITDLIKDDLKRSFENILKASPLIKRRIGETTLIINKLEVKGNIDLKEVLINVWKECSPCILEPIMFITLLVADEKYENIVIEELNKRRIDKLQIDKNDKINNSNVLVMRGEIPALELLSLEIELAVITKGNVLIEFKFKHWKKLPGSIDIKNTKNIKNIKKNKNNKKKEKERNLELLIFEKIQKQNVK